MKHFYLAIVAITLSLTVEGQLTIVSGTIKEQSTGKSLTGVNIMVENTLEGTISGNDGSFKLETSVSLPFKLVFSMIGFKSVESDITGDL